MANPKIYRSRQVRLIPRPIGVYALCDLDEVPIYVGRSEDGIQARVRRHLTSARSDVIANRQLDVWEVAFVWAWPVTSQEHLGSLEALLFHRFNDQKRLMNGSVPALVETLDFPEPEMHRVQIMEEQEIRARQDPALRLPRQVEHFGQLLNHILYVKDTPQLRLSLAAHFGRLASYYTGFTTTQPTEQPPEAREAEDG